MSCNSLNVKHSEHPKTPAARTPRIMGLFFTPDLALYVLPAQSKMQAVTKVENPVVRMLHFIRLVHFLHMRSFLSWCDSDRKLISYNPVPSVIFSFLREVSNSGKWLNNEPTFYQYMIGAMYITPLKVSTINLIFIELTSGWFLVASI